MLTRKMFLECSQYFSRMHLKVFYNVVKFQIPSYNTFRVMNYFPVWFLVKSRQTDRQTESDAYEPTVRVAQVGSKKVRNLLQIFSGIGILSWQNLSCFRNRTGLKTTYNNKTFLWRATHLGTTKVYLGFINIPSLLVNYFMRNGILLVKFRVISLIIIIF